MRQFKGIDITKINLTTNDLIRDAVMNHGDKEFLIYSPYQSVDTFGQFYTKVNKISNLLKEEFGIKPGDRVSTMSENIPELLYAIMAITNLGALWVPINSMLVGESLKYIVETSESLLLLASNRYKNTVQEVIEKLRYKRIALAIIEELLKHAESRSGEYKSPAKPDDPSMIIFTSGTTGFPKGVVHTHNSYIRTAVRGLEALGTDSSHRIHLFLPFFHGWAYLVLLGSLYYKCSLILEDRFHEQTYWKVIKKYNITQDHWTGTVPINLMKLPKTEYEEKVHMKVLGTFGALYEAMKKRWPKIEFYSLYGQTEHPFITEVPPGYQKPGSDGIPKFPDEILILDDEGNPVPPGKTGEIVCRCRCGVAMKEYYKNPKATAETLKGNDLYTGDLGYLDEEGHLHFVGRKKDALRVRGEMVSVEYIEHLISDNSKIAECAIVGYRSSGEKEALKEDEIVAHVVLRNGEHMTPQEFQEWSEKNLARFMRPRYIVFRDSLPKTGTERVQRYKLKEEGIQGAIKLF